MQVLVNNGLLSFSRNNFVAAQESFQKAASAAAKTEPSSLNDGESFPLTESFQIFTPSVWGWTCYEEKAVGNPV